MKEFFLQHKKMILISAGALVALIIIIKLRAGSSSDSGDVIDTGGYGGITLATPTGTGATSFGSGAVNIGGSTVPGTTNTTPHTKKKKHKSTVPADTGTHSTGTNPSTEPVFHLPPGTHIQ